ncbi:MAG: CIA30 family protein [Acidobacteria bacterium]|nr:CIA30 family protein [Acidobacteriota bacterium]
MKRGRLGGLLVLVALVLLGGWAAHVARWEPLPLVGEKPGDGYARAVGVVHVHTTLSDGGGTPEEVIAAARAVGLDFVGITDHNNVDAKPLEGRHDEVLVLVGTEISTVEGHLLALGLDEDPVYRFSRSGLEDLEDVRDLGGFSFAAHPFSSRSDLRWTGWDLPGPWGMELINGDSEWRRAGLRGLSAMALYALNSRWALLQGLNSPHAALDRWDELLAQRDVVGLYGADAHSRLPITRSWAVRFPSYEALFSLLRSHVLLDRSLSGDEDADRAAVLDALRTGRSYIGLDALAPADGFTFTVHGGGGEQWTMGERVPFQEGLHARVGGRVPRGARVLLFRDGSLVRQQSLSLEAPLPGPGVYRAEVRVPGWPVPWVISNAVAVFDEATFAARDEAAAWPEPPPAPEEVLGLATLPGSSAFGAEFDPTSWMDTDVLDPTGGPEDTPALKLAFRLGAPTLEQPFTWCALVNRQERDLAAYRGLRFRVRADGVYRVWVQVRDANPDSADDGEEWWMASVRTSRDWQQVLLPFSRFRTINERTDGRLDPDQTRALVFVLDHAAVKPGTEGTIWIAGLGVYR